MLLWLKLFLPFFKLQNHIKLLYDLIILETKVCGNIDPLSCYIFTKISFPSLGSASAPSLSTSLNSSSNSPRFLFPLQPMHLGFVHWFSTTSPNSSQKQWLQGPSTYILRVGAVKLNPHSQISAVWSMTMWQFEQRMSMCRCGGGVGGGRRSFSRRGREIDMLGVYRMVSVWVA